MVYQEDLEVVKELDLVQVQQQCSRKYSASKSTARK
jgi:hypothetical protein